MIETGRRTPPLQWLGIQIAQIGLICLLFALFFGLGMLFFWHANDFWPHWSALDIGWLPPQVAQPRLQQLLALAYQLPLGALAGIAGLLLTLAGVALSRN